MAVIPSFSAFARGPDLVGARSKADEINQRAAIAGLSFLNQRRQLDQNAQRLAAQERMNAQDNAVRQQIAEQNAQQEKVKLDISRAYNEARIGLAKQELENEAVQLGRQYQAQQAYQTELANLMQQPGMTEEKAARTAAFKHFPSMGIPIPASAFKATEERPEAKIIQIPIPGSSEPFNVLDTGTSYQPLPGQGRKGEAELVAEETQQSAGKIRNEIRRLERELAGARGDMSNYEILVLNSKAPSIATLEAQLEEARSQLEEITSTPATSQSTTNRLGRFEIITD